MRFSERPVLVDLDALGPVDEGAHSWGFGAFLLVEREYEGDVPPDDDPGDLARPWLAA